MICAWQSFLSVLPLWMRNEVDKQGKDTLRELRLRLHAPPALVLGNCIKILERPVTGDDLHFCVNTASRYSPWTASTAKEGYITVQGGHRIGICGHSLGTTGSVTQAGGLSSLCIRIARDFSGIEDATPGTDSSILIIGSPGSGKTTLLRDLIRKRSNHDNACVAVVDERCEIFPRIQGQFCFSIGKNTDVLSGFGKVKGIEMMLRTMSPTTIAIDEITAAEDCNALLHAGWCGVSLIATAHAASMSDLISRPIYRPIIERKLFTSILVLDKHQSWHLERLPI